jgi:hypothetical protein
MKAPRQRSPRRLPRRGQPPRSGPVDVARHIIDTNFQPSSLSHVASDDVASNICQAHPPLCHRRAFVYIRFASYMASYDVSSNTSQAHRPPVIDTHCSTLVCRVEQHPVTWRAMSTRPYSEARHANAMRAAETEAPLGADTLGTRTDKLDPDNPDVYSLECALCSEVGARQMMLATSSGAI